MHESAEGVVPAASSRFDLHKRVNKRHILTGTLGLLITAAVTPANWQDRDAASGLVQAARQRGRDRLARIWADRAYQGDCIGLGPARPRHHHRDRR